MAAAQAAFDAKEANVLSALEQIEDLNSELTTGAAERFKLVAAVHSEKRRHNQQTSSLENKVKKTEDQDRDPRDTDKASGSGARQVGQARSRA